ncbi:hypothetical protein Tco_0623115 [Tanacetum coccineum]
MIAIQAEEGEGSRHHSEPQPPPSTAQPTNKEPILNVVSSSYQKNQTHRKALNQVTKLPQTSEPIPNVSDEVVYEEWNDRVERATITAASLDAEQASGNINRTQSTTMPNVPLPQGMGYDTTRIDGFMYNIVQESGELGGRLEANKEGGRIWPPIHINNLGVEMSIDKLGLSLLTNETVSVVRGNLTWLEKGVQCDITGSMMSFSLQQSPHFVSLHPADKFITRKLYPSRSAFSGIKASGYEQRLKKLFMGTSHEKFEFFQMRLVQSCDEVLLGANSLPLAKDVYDLVLTSRGSHQLGGTCGFEF